MYVKREIITLQGNNLNLLNPHNTLQIDTTPTSIENQINLAYKEVVKYRRNIFCVPKGPTGKDFVREMTKLIVSWNTKPTTLKQLIIMPSLLLQNPSPKYKVAENRDHL